MCYGNLAQTEPENRKFSFEFRVLFVACSKAASTLAYYAMQYLLQSQTIDLKPMSQYFKRQSQILRIYQVTLDEFLLKKTSLCELL